MKFFALALTVLLVSACGGSGDGAADTTDDGAPNDPVVESTPLGTASISGMIAFDGEAPARTPVRMKPECMDQHDSDPLSEDAIVNDGALQNTFVYVSAGLPDGYAFEAPSASVTLDQVGCMYTPRVMGMQAGQTLRIENSDPFQHNVHPFPENNRSFNESTPNEGDYLEKTFLVPEVMISVKCDVHAWMQAYIGVLDHPYFATSGADGSFTISGLPAGAYTVTTWHEQFGAQEMQVTVGDGETAQVDVTYSATS